MWTEYQKTPEAVEYMVFPRLLALSEVVWSPPERKGLRFTPAAALPSRPAGAAESRLQDSRAAGTAGCLHRCRGPCGGATYLDGSRWQDPLHTGRTDPDERSPLYQSPLRVPLVNHRPVKVNMIVVTPAGRRSVVYGATLLRRPLEPAVPYQDRKPGLAFTLFRGRFVTTMDLDGAAPTAAGRADSIGLASFEREADYGVIFKGYVNVSADGYYQFGSESDDGSMLYVDDEEVVANDREHGRYLVSGHIPLAKGFHRIEVKYFQMGGESALRVLWAPSGQQLRVIEPSALFH